MNEFLKISLGGVRSEPDYRDIPMSAVLGAPAGLPQQYQAQNSQLPIWYQRRIGACVGHAAGKKKQNQELDETQSVIPINPRFIYAIAKSLDGLIGEGTYYRLGMKVLQKYGAPPEIPDYTNDTELTHADYIDLKKIPQQAYDLAKKYAIASYAMVGSYLQISEEQLMQAISAGNGALLGVQVGKEWWTTKQGVPSWNETDLLPLRPPAAIVSGHAIFPDGYEVVGDSKLKVNFINSWSDQWGHSGRGWFWYHEYKPFLVEAWSAVDLPNNYLDTVKQLPDAKTFKHYFATDLVLGQKDNEVKALQTALMIDGDFPRDLYAELLKTNELGYYKPNGVTQTAVRDFQYKHKVASLPELIALNGRRVGPKTRAKLNQLYGNS